MKIPDWWEAVILSAAAWRMWYLVALEASLDRPRRYVTRLGKQWQKDGDPTPKEYRLALAQFIECPYCLGAWVALGWWGAWLIWPLETLYAGTPFLLSAGVIGAHRILSGS